MRRRPLHRGRPRPEDLCHDERPPSRLSDSGQTLTIAELPRHRTVETAKMRYVGTVVVGHSLYEAAGPGRQRMRHEISYTIGHDRSVAIVAEDEGGAQDGQRLRWLPIDSIDLSVDQPRRVFNEEALDELTDSVRQYGVLQPIRVRMCGERHQVVAGHRRVMAARRAGLDSVPAVVAGRDDNRALIEALIENIQREELNPIDRGEALQRLRVNLGAQSWEEVGRVIGISRRHVYHLLNIAALPDPIRADIQAGNVNEKHGRALLRLRA